MSVFLLKNGIRNSRNFRNYGKNFESKIREYAGPQAVIRDWVRVYCIGEFEAAKTVKRTQPSH